MNKFLEKLFKREPEEKEFVKPEAWKSEEELKADIKKKKAPKPLVKSINLKNKLKRLKIKNPIKAIPIPVFQIGIKIPLKIKRIVAGLSLALSAAIIFNSASKIVFDSLEKTLRVLPVVILFIPNCLILLDYIRNIGK